MNSREYIVFVVNDLTCAVDVANVQEIHGPLSITRVPQVHPAIAGLINLRGQVLTSVDLKTRLGLGKADNPQEQVNVITYNPARTMSMLVDDAHDEIAIRDTMLQEPPETLAPQLRPFIRKVCPRQETLMLILDVNNLMDFQSLEMGGHSHARDGR